MATFLFTALFLFLMCNDAAADSNSTSDKGLKPTVSLTYALLLILGFGVFAALVALTFDLVRRYVYHDADNLDTAFDAGGKVTMGLTASTIVSQWTWAGALLQASTVATKYGISGPFWYASGATIQIILFAILSIQLKTKAPGAKTFLQVVRARFGKKVHIVYVVFAGFTNLVVTASLLLGGTAVLTGLIQGLSMELAVLVLTVVIGTYTLIGGLGATFYVSYFNTTLIFIMLMILVTEVYHNPFNNPKNPFGSSSEVYRYLNMTIGPDGNEENSYLTFLSSGGLMFGIINIIGNFGTVVCDQSYWQSSVAAKPIHGVWGFISGGLTWFAIPFTMATTMGLAYLAFTAFIGAPLLTPGDVDAGLVPPVIAQRLLGSPGEFIIIILLLQAIMSTGSAEVIAVSSIIIYDIYKVHIKPFRPDTEWYDCENCGKINSSSEKLKDMKGTGYCECPPMVSCAACLQDTLDRKQSKLAVKPHYKCEVHGKYKEYQELLLHKKNWCIVWVTMAIIPIVLLCKVANLNLSWVYLFTGVLIGCAVIPISLSVLWTRVNGYGMVAGTGTTAKIKPSRNDQNEEIAKFQPQQLKQPRY